MNITMATWNIRDMECSHGHWKLLHALAPTIGIITECRSIKAAPEWVTDHNFWPERRIAIFVSEGTLSDAGFPHCCDEFRSCVWKVEGQPPVSVTGAHVTTASYLKRTIDGLNALSAAVPPGPTIVAGDFNINPGYEAGRFPVFRALLGQMRLRSLWHECHSTDFGGEPPTLVTTRKKKNGEPFATFMIDYIFASPEFTISVADIDDMHSKSDHKAVWVTCSLQPR